MPSATFLYAIGFLLGLNGVTQSDVHLLYREKLESIEFVDLPETIIIPSEAGEPFDEDELLQMELMYTPCKPKIWLYKKQYSLFCIPKLPLPDNKFAIVIPLVDKYFILQLEAGSDTGTVIKDDGFNKVEKESLDSIVSKDIMPAKEL